MLFLYPKGNYFNLHKNKITLIKLKYTKTKQKQEDISLNTKSQTLNAVSQPSGGLLF